MRALDNRVTQDHPTKRARQSRQPFLRLLVRFISKSTAVIAQYLAGTIDHYEAVQTISRGATRKVKIARAVMVLRGALRKEYPEYFEVYRHKDEEEII